MHKKVVIIGAGPAGLLLARMLFNRGIDCLILENRNEIFLRKLNRGGSLGNHIVQTLLEEKASNNLITEGIPLTQFDFQIGDKKIELSLLLEGKEKQQKKHTKHPNHPIIYDQKNLVADLIDGLKTDEAPIISEAKAQRYEGLESDKVNIIYTLDGQLNEISCDYVVGCDGYRGISRRSIPNDLRTETKEELPYAWLEWIVNEKPSSQNPVIALNKNGFAMQMVNANDQTRCYLQVKRGIEMDDLPAEEKIWDMVKERLGTPVFRSEMLNKKLDYMRSFHTNLMQFGRLFIAGEAAHQVPRFGSKGFNMAMADSIKLAQAFTQFYNDKDESYLKNYSKECLSSNLKIISYTKYLNQLFHKNEEENTKAQQNEIETLLTDEIKKQEFIDYLVG